MPFANPILGGDNLIRPQAQSPNFVAGVSGWIIRRDGSAEFNNLIARGSVVVGPVPGAHVIVDATTDTILMFDAANSLMMSISPVNQTIGGITVRSGITTYNTTQHDLNARIVGEQIQFRDLVTVPTSTPGLILPQNLSATGGVAGVAFLSGSVAGSPQSGIQMFSESGDGTVGAHILVTQQDAGGGPSHQGDMVQSTPSGKGAFRHVGVLPGGAATDAAGNYTLTHGAPFTPTGGTVMYDSTGRAGGPHCASLFNFAATTIGTHWENAGAAFALSNVFGTYEMWR